MKVSAVGLGNSWRHETMRRWLGWVCVALVLTGCGDDSTTVVIDPAV
jgi:hypothetical protein